MVIRSFLLCLALAACTGDVEERLTWFTGVTMGTGYSVQITDLPSHLDPKVLEQDINQLLEEINGLMSTYQEESELSRLNRNGSTEWIPISAELATVLEEAQRISRLTEGAFDVTVGPLVNLWGFGPSGWTQGVPSTQEVEAARERVNFAQLQLRRSPPALKKARGEVYIDLSALAKGYGVDRIVEFLEAKGVRHYLVDIGGEERVRGHSPRGGPWRIAIEQPVAGKRQVQRIMELDSGAVATSGDYRNYFDQEGKRYSHTIDPRMGWPISHRLASVTVLSETAMRADALATALMVLGPGPGFALAEQEQIAALLIIKTKTAGGFMEKATPEFTKINSWTLPAKGP